MKISKLKSTNRMIGVSEINTKDGFATIILFTTLMWDDPS